MDVNGLDNGNRNGDDDGAFTQPPGFTMAPTIQTEQNGSISAFTSNNKLVMIHGRPIVNCYLEIKQLHDSITTLEELLSDVELCHKITIMELLAVLKTASQKHELEHDEITAAPTADDQLAYLVAYAAAIGI